MRQNRRLIDTRLGTLKAIKVLVKHWNLTSLRLSYHSHLRIFVAAPFSSEGIPAKQRRRSN